MHRVGYISGDKLWIGPVQVTALSTKSTAASNYLTSQVIFNRGLLPAFRQAGSTNTQFKFTDFKRFGLGLCTLSTWPITNTKLNIKELYQ